MHWAERAFLSLLVGTACVLLGVQVWIAMGGA